MNWHLTIFSNFAEPNFLSKLRRWLTPCLTSSPQFIGFPIYANSHFDVHCKTEEPTVQRTAICDTHTCVVFTGNLESSELSFYFSHSHHPPVVLLESLPLSPMFKSLHLELTSCSVHDRISKWSYGNKDPWCNRQEMKWRMPWDLSVHNMTLQFDHTCCLDRSELGTCLRFPV